MTDHRTGQETGQTTTTAKLELSRRDTMLGLGAAAAGAAIGGLGIPQDAAAKAAMLGPSAANHHRVKLGNFEITAIRDGALTLPGPHPIFGQNIKAGELQDLAEKNFLPRDKFVLGFTPVLVNTGNELIMFDAGNGGKTGRRPKAGMLASRLKAAGFNPADVDIVVVTHFHPDHIGGLMEGDKPLFPNARYVTGEAEYNFWTHGDRASGPTARVHKLVNANVKPLAEKATFIKPGADVVTGITSIDAFGHTPGHMAYNIESNGRRLVLTADTCNHFVVSMQRPDWHVRFDAQKEKAAKARKTIFGMIAADKVPFVGYHMPFPSIGYVEPLGPGFRYVAESYQLDL